MKNQTWITAACCLAAIAAFSSADAQIGRRFPSEMSTYNDPVTGIPVKVLTNSPEHSDSRIYQTHPQWTYDNKYIAFRSGRSGGGQLFFVNEQSGEIIQITDGPGTGDYNLSRKQGLLYFMRRPRPVEGQPRQPARIMVLDTDAVLRDSERGQMKPYTEYEREICVWPDSLSVSGGMGLDVAEDMLYIGVNPPVPAGWVSPIPDLDRIPNRPGGIRSVKRECAHGRDRLRLQCRLHDGPRAGQPVRHARDRLLPRNRRRFAPTDVVRRHEHEYLPSTLY